MAPYTIPAPADQHTFKKKSTTPCGGGGACKQWRDEKVFAVTHQSRHEKLNSSHASSELKLWHLSLGSPFQRRRTCASWVQSPFRVFRLQCPILATLPSYLVQAESPWVISITQVHDTSCMGHTSCANCACRWKRLEDAFNTPREVLYPGCLRD